MPDYRVIVSGNSGDGFSFRIEELYSRAGRDPVTGIFASFFIDTGDKVSDTSVDGLREKLKAMLEACDKPVLLVWQTDPVLLEWGK